MRRQADVIIAAAILITLGIVAAAGQDASDGEGIHKIRHVVIIMQENRSFDHYFGTFPGAEGIPMQNGTPTACLTAPGSDTCFRPYADHSDRNGGAPHSADAAKGAIDDGKMDGFVAVATTAVRRKGCGNTTDPNCGEDGGLRPERVMAYHVESDIPNYWAYAREFVLQDHMFEPVASWSLPSHLYMVSAWSAECAEPSIFGIHLEGYQKEAASCRSDLARKHAENTMLQHLSGFPTFARKWYALAGLNICGRRAKLGSATRLLKCQRYPGCFSIIEALTMIRRAPGLRLGSR